MFGAAGYVEGVLEHTSKNRILYNKTMNIVLNYERELIKTIQKINPSYTNIKILEIIGGD